MNLNPNDIKLIHILKDSEINAIFGCYSKPLSAILITTKKANERTISVKDFVTGEPLEGAYVELISKKNIADTTKIVADKSGNITTQKVFTGEVY